MIAITGAAGFIGSNVAQFYGEGAREVILVDHPVSPAKITNWVGMDVFRYFEHQRFLTALRDQEIPKLKKLIHLGACSSTTETDWGYLESNNIDYTRTLWNWCAENDCTFIYASSAATYGDGSLGFDDRTPPSDLKPLNLYGKSKNDFDAWALATVAAGQPAPRRWGGFKFFNVYGPREVHKGRMASVVYQAWRQIKEVGYVKLFKSNSPEFPDGGHRRDFVYVGDCLDHMLWFSDEPIPSGLYNSGTGVAETFLDLALAVFKAMGKSPDIRFIDMPADLAGKYQNFTQADMTKIRGAGYPLPPTSLEKGVSQTVDWFEGRSRL